MRKESFFKADHATAKRVYQSPDIRLVKLGTTTLLAGSIQVGDPWENTLEGEL